MKTICCLLTTLVLLTRPSAADVIPEGAGIIYGSDHVFALKAPKEWVLDNGSAVKQGLHAVFYPKDSTWKDSKVVAYARATPIDKKTKSAKDVVDRVLADFHANGSPNYKATKDKSIKLEGGKTGTIYKFSGDKWGNHEAVCYFKEEKTINFVVLSSRDKKAFDDAWKAFQQLCESYTYISDSYSKGIEKKILETKSDEKKDPSADKKKVAPEKKQEPSEKKEAE